MKVSKINLAFNSGWFFVLALTVQISIAIRVNHWLWGLAYLIILNTLLKNRCYPILIEVLVLTGISWWCLDLQVAARPTIHQIIVQPDQWHYRNHWVSGVGQLPTGQKVRFGGPSDHKWPASAHKIMLYGDWHWQRLTPATNPGEFDFQKYNHYQKIDYQAQIKTWQVRYQPRSLKPIDCLHRWRFYCLQFLKPLPHWLRVNASSLLWGYFPNEEVDLRQGLTNLGIIHIFSISGLHVYLLVDLLYQLTAKLRLPQNYVEWFLVVSLPAFAVLAGSGVGIWRACGLQIIRILQSKLHWQLSRHDVFGIVLLVQTFLEPYVLFTLAGQLSYLLSYGLIVARQRKSWQRSLLINFLSMPILLYHNYTFSWLTFGANLVLTPVFEKIIIPLTLLSLLCVNCPLILAGLEQLFKGVYAPIQGLAHANWSQITFGHISVFLTVLLMIVTLLWLNEKSSHWYRLLAVVYLGIFIVNHCPLSGEVSIIDIGQGDSILITTPFLRKTCLIDTGGKLQFGRHLVQTHRVEQITIPYLHYRGITHLDYVFLSHQDADHIGDLAILLKNFPVREVCFAQGMEHSRALVRQLQPFAQQVHYQTLKVNDELKLKKYCKFLVLWPKRLSTGVNEDSLTLLIKIQNTKWLFSGDLNRENELKLFTHIPHLDYVKAGHHGSKTASDPQFLKQAHPRLVLISAGRKNRYGHPHPETLHTLKKLQIPYLNTAEHGMLTWHYTLNGQQWWQIFTKDQINANQ